MDGTRGSERGGSRAGNRGVTVDCSRGSNSGGVRGGNRLVTVDCAWGSNRGTNSGRDRKRNGKRCTYNKGFSGQHWPWLASQRFPSKHHLAAEGGAGPCNTCTGDTQPPGALTYPCHVTRD